MNGSKELVGAYHGLIDSLPYNLKDKLIVCPPYPYLSDLYHDNFSLGAQDAYPFAKGAYTGDVSAHILKEFGAQYVILGHSERRLHHSESNDLIQRKVKSVLDEGLTPIVCIGETLDQKDKTLKILAQQLKACVANTDDLVIIAYEPIWAIGTGQVATIKDIESAHEFIKSVLPKSPVLYGGSVTSENAKGILSLKTVDGVLVGGASLKPKEVYTIIRDCQ